MNLITDQIKNDIDIVLIEYLGEKDYQNASDCILRILHQLYINIPDKKRISYGRVYTLKVLVNHLVNSLKEDALCEYGSGLFDFGINAITRGVGLGLITEYGISNFQDSLVYFQRAASDEQWDLREHAQMYFRKLIKKHPDNAQVFLIEQVKSDNENIRRFVSETLRPVQENKWIIKSPEYSLKVLQNLFYESKIYPRTSVGNNLSDLSRYDPEMIYDIVDELVKSGDKNAYWIATRACRNLVKKEPIRVMNLLQVDEYKYKSAKYKRSDYEGN